MKKSVFFLRTAKIIAALSITTSVIFNTFVNVNSATVYFGWGTDDDRDFWYEENVRQGTYSDSKGVLGDGTVRGREIYDGVTDAWYWLDACFDGKKAFNKEVWMPYVYSNEDSADSYELAMLSYSESTDLSLCVRNAINNKTGKWVRYNSEGKMVKGWYTVEPNSFDAMLYPTQVGNTYYYDMQTGLMAKGLVTIDNKKYIFDEVSGALVEAPTVTPGCNHYNVNYGYVEQEAINSDIEAVCEISFMSEYPCYAKYVSYKGNVIYRYDIDLDAIAENVRFFNSKGYAFNEVDEDNPYWDERPNKEWGVSTGSACWMSYFKPSERIRYYDPFWQSGVSIPTVSIRTGTRTTYHILGQVCIDCGAHSGSDVRSWSEESAATEFADEAFLLACGNIYTKAFSYDEARHNLGL